VYLFGTTRTEQAMAIFDYNNGHEIVHTLLTLSDTCCFWNPKLLKHKTQHCPTMDFKRIHNVLGHHGCVVQPTSEFRSMQIPG
jgi:hypothetical protein